MDLDLTDIQDRLSHYHPGPMGQQRHYAVLLPLIEVDGDLHILYEIRASHISQGGDTSFPGGKVEAGESFQAAALRESNEELGIPPHKIDLLGEIDYLISDRAIIHCWVGHIHDFTLADLNLNEEVDQIFTIPLRFFLENPPLIRNIPYLPQPKKDFPYQLINQGRDYPFRHISSPIYFYQLSNHSLWGLTARFTAKFIDIIRENN